MTNIKSLAEMLELLIAIITRCVHTNDKGQTDLSHKWKFEFKDQFYVMADVIAEAQVHVMNLKDEVGLSSVIRVTQRCFNDLVTRNSELEEKYEQALRDLQSFQSKAKR